MVNNRRYIVWTDCVSEGEYPNNSGDILFGDLDSVAEFDSILVYNTFGHLGDRHKRARAKAHLCEGDIHCDRARLRLHMDGGSDDPRVRERVVQRQDRRALGMVALRARHVWECARVQLLVRLPTGPGRVSRLVLHVHGQGHLLRNWWRRSSSHH